MTIQEVKCAKCNVALKGPADPTPQDRFECPRCGIGDSLQRVMAEISEYATEQVASALGRTLGATFRDSKNVKLTKTAPKQALPLRRRSQSVAAWQRPASKGLG